MSTGAALEGLRVVDLSGSLAGAWCSRMLADFGADVAIVEAPHGHPARALEPMHDGRSVTAAYVLANKRSIALDAGRAEDRDHLDALLQAADVIVEGSGEGSLVAWGADREALLDRRAGLVVTSITPFGLTGPLAGLPGNDLTAYARSGWASVNGLASREPLKGSGITASLVSGISAYGATVSALVEREHSGRGQHLDVAETEVMLSLGSPGLTRSQYQGVAWPRRERVDAAGSFPVATRDGYLSVMLGIGGRMRDALLALDLESLADDERFVTRAGRELHREELFGAIEAVLREQDRDELFGRLAMFRIIAGPVLTMDELATNEQLRDRGFFVHPEDQVRDDGPDDGLEYLGAPFKMALTPWRLRNAEPAIGADGEALITETHDARVSDPPARPPAVAASSDRFGPLAGTRAVVLTHAWIGTYCTELLGLLGCDVIQVETRKRLDSWRAGYDAVMPAELRDVPSAEHAWNCSPMFNSVNLNKRGITLDLAYDEGRELFERLVADADIVVENFSPRVVGQLGVDYESLRRIQPDLIMLSMSGYGGSGPWRDTLGIGGTVEPTSGMSSLLGYRDSQPFNSGQMFPDPVGGLHGFAALMTALYHRERTGQGQYIDLSMQESCATVIGDALLDYLWTHHIRPRLGNRHATFAPAGIFAATGDQRWVALAAESDEQWRALANVAGHPEWLQDQRFASNEVRKLHEDELDAVIAAWVGTEDRDDVVGRLLSSRVPAAPVLDGLEVGSDLGYRERGVVVDLDHMEAGRWAQVGVPYHFSRTTAKVTRASPVLGEHSREVLCEELGLSPAAYAGLEERGITGQGPPP